MPAKNSSLYGSSILSRYSKKGDLINYLNDLHIALSELSQEIGDRPKGLKSTAAQLVSPKLLSHNDKDVRILTTCCIVDVLRVFAPESPYNNEDTLSAFQAITNQLRGLATYDSVAGIASSKVYYILNSISTVQSCVVPVILGQTGVHGAEEMVVSMFEAIFASVRQEHPEEVLAHAGSVLQACIEESDTVSEELLEILLLPLLPHSKGDHPTAYQLASSVLRRVWQNIQAPVTTILNQVLVGTSRDTSVRSSELVDHIYALIYELHTINPALLNGVLPNLCLQLQVEESDIRLKAVQVLGNLFASPYAEYAHEFERNFREFLCRLNDLSGDIRLELVESCSLILQNRPNMLSTIEEPLVKRLRDPDAGVRLTVLSKLIDVAYARPLDIQPATFLELGERVKDKRDEVRRTAMVGLAKIYSRHISSVLPALSDLRTSPSASAPSSSSSSSSSNHSHQARDLVPRDLLERLEFVPGLLMKCWGFPDKSIHYLIVHLVQEQLLPRVRPTRHSSRAAVAVAGSGFPSAAAASLSSNDQNDAEMSSDDDFRNNAPKRIATAEDQNEQRACALLLLYECLSSPQDRHALAALMGWKGKVRQELQSFLHARSSRGRSSVGSTQKEEEEEAASQSSSSTAGSGSSGSTNSTEDNLRLLRKCMLRLVQLLPTTDNKKTTHMEKLYATKDRTVFGLLQGCVLPTECIGDALVHRDDLKRRLDSKSVLGELMGQVYDIAGYLTVNTGVTHSLLQYIATVGVHADSVVPSELLVMLAKHAPQTFQQGIEDLTDWLSTCVSNEHSNATSSKSSKLRDVKASLFSDSIAMIRSTCSLFSSSAAPTTGPASADSATSQQYLCSELVSLMRHNSYPQICSKLAELLGLVVYYSSFDAPVATQQRKSAARVKAADAVDDEEEESPVRIAQDLLKTLISSKCLSLRNKRLESDLGVLAALCVVPKAAYSALDFKRAAFIAMMQSLMISVKAPLVSFIQKTIAAAAAGGSEVVSADVVAAALTAWTSILSTQQELLQLHVVFPDGDAEDEEQLKEEEAAMEFRSFITLLFECIESGGEHVAGFAADEAAERELLFETAACCAFSLIHIKSFAVNMSIDQWHTLGWTLLSPSPQVRHHILSTMSRTISMHPVHPKFLAYPCLFATDEGSASSLFQRADQALAFAVQRLRRTHEELCSAAIDDKRQSQSGAPNHHHKDLRKLAASHVPESILPYLLHLLSYHPEFPTSISVETEQDKRRMKAVVRSLRMLLNVLQSSLVSNDSSNLSYIFKQLNTINQYCVDRHDPDNIGLHFVTRMTVKLLNEQVKTSDNLQMHPGDIYLPSELYKRKASSSSLSRAGAAGGNDGELMADGAELAARNIAMDDGIREGLEEAEIAIDKVLQIAGKGRSKATTGGGGGGGLGGGAGGTSIRSAAAAGKLLGSDTKPSRKRASESPHRRRSSLSSTTSNTSGHGGGSGRKSSSSITSGRGGGGSARHSDPSAAAIGTALKSLSSKLPAEAPTRSLPRRGAKEAVVNYREPVENDREMHRWEEAAGAERAAAKKPRRSSELSSYGFGSTASASASASASAESASAAGPAVRGVVRVAAARIRTSQGSTATSADSAEKWREEEEEIAPPAAKNNSVVLQVTNSEAGADSDDGGGATNEAFNAFRRSFGMKSQAEEPATKSKKSAATAGVGGKRALQPKRVDANANNRKEYLGERDDVGVAAAVPGAAAAADAKSMKRGTTSTKQQGKQSAPAAADVGRDSEVSASTAAAVGHPPRRKRPAATLVEENAAAAASNNAAKKNKKENPADHHQQQQQQQQQQRTTQSTKNTATTKSLATDVATATVEGDGGLRRSTRGIRA